MTRVERNKKFAKNAARIAALEKKVAELESEIEQRDLVWEIGAGEREAALGQRVEALYAGLADHLGGRLPLCLQLEFDALVEELEARRPYLARNGGKP
jgi:hypothetical protein